MHITWKIFVISVAVFFLSGCSSKQVVLPPGAASIKEKTFMPESLWGLNIEQGGEEKFSGILAIKSNNDSVSIALLDPTGIKLFEENVAKTGEIQLLSAVEQLTKHRLPRFIGKAIYRIFYLYPGDDSCSGIISRFCWSDEVSPLEKKYFFGPVLLWSVAYTVDIRERDIIKIQTHSPWSDTGLFLKLMD